MTDTLLFAAFAVAYAVLLVGGARSASRHGWWTPANLTLLVVLGLFYDNALLAVGKAVGEGTPLETLSLGRYWVHAFVTPLLVLVAWHAAARASRAADRWGWLRSRTAGAAAAALTVALVALELATVLLGLRIEAHETYGVLSYSKVSDGGPPLMVITVALVLLVAGALVGVLQKWWWLFVGAAAMTLGSAVTLPVPSGAVTNAFELVLLTSILLTAFHQNAVERRAGAGPGPQAPHNVMGTGRHDAQLP
jgi:hypothetical protein